MPIHLTDQDLSALREGAPPSALGHECAEVIKALVAALDAAKKRNAELEAVISRLPKTADGVPCVPGMRVYPLHSFDEEDGATLKLAADAYEGFLVEGDELIVSTCYSTRAAAEAAKGGSPCPA